MNKKIKMLSVGVALVGLFFGANVALAQTAVVASCNSAIVDATLTDTGGATTSAWFEWGTSYTSVDAGFGTKTTTQSFNTAPQYFTQTISGLNQSTTYYYRVVFSNIYGSSHSVTASFVTPSCGTTVSLPAVTTSNASSVSQNTAVINGYVTPNGASAYTWFEWGTSSALGNVTASVNSGTAPTSISNSLSNLSANTTYYYRAVAQNSQGTVRGNILSFITSGSTTTTPATIITQTATNVSFDYATLNGYMDPNGTNDTTRWFEWGTNSNPGNQYQTTHYNQGTAGTFSAGVSGLAQNTTYYYRAVAQNSQGTVYGGIHSFTTNNNGNTCGSWGYGTNCGNSIVMVSTRNADTSSDFAVLNGYVDPNGTNDTTRWFEWGGSQSLGNSTQKLSHGNVASNFSASLTGLVSNTTYYYRAAGRNSQGTVYGNILSFTTGAQTTGTIVGTLPAVTTLLATEIAGSTAKLNGLVFESAGQTSNAWFEWGANSNLGNKTQTINIGNLSVAKHSDFITGLVQGQTYYYRIVAENPYGKVYGSVNTFVAEVNTSVNIVTPTVKTPVVLKPTTVAVARQNLNQSSLISLALEGGDEVITPGEKRTYHVAWKNNSNQSLHNVVIRVTFPQTINVDSATKGSFSSRDNSVLIDLKTVASGENGDIFIFATANRNLKSSEMLIVTADMVYTGTNKVQGDVLAYVTHRAESASNALSANIFNAGEFLPTTLFEWILLIAMVLLLVLLGNHLYGRFSDTAH